MKHKTSVTFFYKARMKSLLKDVTHFYHSNSVANSIKFILEKRFLTRNYMFQNTRSLTPQYSDGIDIKYGIFDSVFFETKYDAKQLSVFGPVIFKVKKPIVFTERLFPRGRLLRDNPEKWKKGIKAADKYFDANSVNKDDIRCLVIDHVSGSIPFGDHLEEIVILDSTAGIYKSKKKKTKKVWSAPNGASYSEAAKTCLIDAFKQIGEIPPPILISPFIWPKRKSDWLSMMYFPGKLFDYEREAEIIWSCRYLNPNIKRDQIEKIKELYQKLQSA